MSVQFLIQQESPLRNESIDVQKAMFCFAHSLCQKFHINPCGLEHVTRFGFVSHNDNCEAISHWVYQKAC